LKKLGEFPQAVAEAAQKRVPHRVTNYIFDLASAFHSFYNAEKVLDAEHADRTAARLGLVKSVQVTFKNALELIGVSAPEKM
ncbi:DALR anticodon-binding domain-containing protein, partial [Enterococcus faecium]|uniref:DALR anticodon-binding domain-containing protein n=1 Tax=Enterococcus faecium TaxID=1352 RepID=UPI0030C85134